MMIPPSGTTAVSLLTLMASPRTPPRPGESQDHDVAFGIKRSRPRCGRPWATGMQRIRSVASAVLHKLGESVVPDLIAGLDDPSPAIRSGAARTLGALRNDARDGRSARSVATTTTPIPRSAAPWRPPSAPSTNASTSRL